MKSKHFLSISTTPLADLMEIFDVTEHQKKTLAIEKRLPFICEGRTLGMLFEKPSLRTRVSFEVAMTQLGGHAIFMGQNEVQIGQREAVQDFSATLCRYVDCIMARVFKHEHVEQIAQHSRVPVINALSDYSHPCQALADLQTIKEHKGKWEGLKLAYVGDGNNVARSLAFICAKLGLKFSIASPSGYSFDDAFLKKLDKVIENKKFSLEMGSDPVKALKGADAVYTDVWASMGQESEKEARKKAMMPYQLNATLMKKAKPDAIVLHCLPAKRGEEVTDEVLDSKQAVVFDQAENRLHTERALLTLLMA